MTVLRKIILRRRQIRMPIYNTRRLSFLMVDYQSPPLYLQHVNKRAILLFLVIGKEEHIAYIKNIDRLQSLRYGMTDAVCGYVVNTLSQSRSIKSW